MWAKIFLICIIFSISPFLFAGEINEQLKILAETECGIYLTFEDFRSNSPIPLEHVSNPFGFADPKYLHSLKKTQIISFHDQYGVKQTVAATAIWGYSTGENIFINVGVGYAKLEIIGCLCFFIADVMVELPQIPSDFGTGGTSFSAQPRYTYEKHQFVLNTKSGLIVECTPKNLEGIISSDSILHSEYSALRNKEKLKMIIPTVTKYNERHPFRFDE